MIPAHFAMRFQALFFRGSLVRLFSVLIKYVASPRQRIAVVFPIVRHWHEENDRILCHIDR